MFWGPGNIANTYNLCKLLYREGLPQAKEEPGTWGKLSMQGTHPERSLSQATGCLCVSTREYKDGGGRGGHWVNIKSNIWAASGLREIGSNFFIYKWRVWASKKSISSWVTQWLQPTWQNAPRESEKKAHGSTLSLMSPRRHPWLFS